MKSVLIFVTIAVSGWTSVLSKSSLQEKNVVYVYQDVSVRKISISKTLFTLKEILPHNYHVRTINSQKVISNQWVKDAAAYARRKRFGLCRKTKWRR